MNKAILARSMMLTMFTVVASSAAVAGSSGSCLVAKTGGDYTTVGAAVGASTCQKAVIDVLPGVYQENVVLRAGKTLRGAGRGHSMIESVNATAPTVIADEDTTIEGFSIKGGTSDYGIYGSYSSANANFNVLDKI